MQIWLTADELAAVYKIKKPTVRSWTRQGMPCLRLGGRLVRFSAQKVQEWFEEKHDAKQEEEGAARVDDARAHNQR